MFCPLNCCYVLTWCSSRKNWSERILSKLTVFRESSSQLCSSLFKNGFAFTNSSQFKLFSSIVAKFVSSLTKLLKVSRFLIVLIVFCIFEGLSTELFSVWFSSMCFFFVVQKTFKLNSLSSCRFEHTAPISQISTGKWRELSSREISLFPTRLRSCLRKKEFWIPPSWRELRNWKSDWSQDPGGALSELQILSLVRHGSDFTILNSAGILFTLIKILRRE